MAVPPKRGRPAQLSRQQIIATAVDMFLEDSGEAFSIHRLARALGITPMAIYRYVDNKDALMQAIALQLMDRFQPRIPEADWPEQLRAWARATRAHFLKHPAFFTILGWQEHVASAWLHQIAVLARIIARSGLEGRELADAVQWAAHTVMGSVYFEISARQSGYKVSREDIGALSPEDAGIVGPIMANLSRKNADAVFRDGVERVIEALKARCPTQSSLPNQL